MKSASMGRKSIPNWRRVSSRTTTQFSKRSKRNCDGVGSGCGGFEWLQRIAEETSNLELRTSNLERSRRQCLTSPGFSVQRSMFDVRRSTFCPYPLRRVKGAWWPSRSSKPLSARSTGRGMFDSYPLRQFHLRFTMDDLRVVTDPLVSRKSQIVNPRKGGGLHDTRKSS